MAGQNPEVGGSEGQAATLSDIGTIDGVRQMTRLAGIGINEVARRLMHVARQLHSSEAAWHGGAVLGPSLFVDTIVDVLGSTVGGGQRARVVLGRLFALCDRDGDGSCTLAELVAGLSVLCGGDKHEKVSLLFRLFDENGDGFLSRSEVRRYIGAVLRVMTDARQDGEAGAASASVGGLTAADADAVADATTQQCFLVADVNKDDQLSLDEFAAWMEGGASQAAIPEQREQASPSERISGRTNMDGTESAVAKYEAAAANPAFSSSSRTERDMKAPLAALLPSFSLEGTDVESLWEALAARCGPDATVGPAEYSAVMDRLVRPEARRDHDRRLAAGEAMWAFFDLVRAAPSEGSGTGKVAHSYSEGGDVEAGSVTFERLACSLAILCTGGDALAALPGCYSLMDADGNGRLEKQEATEMLRGMLRGAAAAGLPPLSALVRDEGEGGARGMGARVQATAEDEDEDTMPSAADAVIDVAGQADRTCAVAVAGLFGWLENSNAFGDSDRAGLTMTQMAEFFEGVDRVVAGGVGEAGSGTLV